MSSVRFAVFRTLCSDRRFAAELTLSAARQAAPYCHARKVIIEEETVPTVNVVDRRETGRLITNGHGSNGHGGNGSNGSNGHGGNGHGWLQWPRTEWQWFLGSIQLESRNSF